MEASLPAEQPVASNKSTNIPTRTSPERLTTQPFLPLGPGNVTGPLYARVRVRPAPRGTAPGASASRLLWPGRSRPGAAGAVGLFGGGDPILLIHRSAAVRLLHLGLGHVDPADPVGLADVHPRLPAVCSARVLARSGVTGSSGSRTSTPPCLCTRYLLIAVDLAPSRCLGYRRRRSGTRGRSKGLRPPRQISLKTPVVHPDYITSRCAGSPTVRADSEHLGTTG